jgi:sugar phosphate isomerase/epimerase
MEIGACAWSFSDVHGAAGSTADPRTVDGLVTIALERGLRAVEFAPQMLTSLPAEEQERVLERITGASLQVVLDVGGSEVPAEIAEAVRRALLLAPRLGASVVRTTISRCLEGDRTRFGRAGWRQHLEALVGPFRSAAAEAADLGVSVGVENHQDICSSELLWLCEQVASDHFGVVMDCGNALAVGEEPASFAERVMPHLKHVHLKDYVVHPTESGWRFVRCALGAGVVDFPDLVKRFDAGAAGTLGCIELGASTARHVRLLEETWWATFEPRPLGEMLDALRTLHRASQPAGLEWRTPSEQSLPPAEIAAYEMEQFDASVEYLRSWQR